MMGLAIAYAAKSQVTFTIEPIVSEKKFSFNVEKPVKNDYGEEITVI